MLFYFQEDPIFFSDLIFNNLRLKKNGNSFAVSPAPPATVHWLFYDSQEGHAHLKIYVFNDFGRLIAIMCCLRLANMLAIMDH